MRKMLYVSGMSALLSGCASQTTFVDYPVVVDNVKAIYTRHSNNDCSLKIPMPEEKEWHVYDQGCKGSADSISMVFPDGYFLLHQREDLNLESQQYLDFLLQKTVEYLDNKNTKRGYNELPF